MDDPVFPLVARPMETFKHAPLDLSKQQIRLLRVMPTSSVGSIECQIHTFVIGDCPKYIAISYAWGPPSPVQEILIDNRTLLVRDNIWHFLNTVARAVEEPFLSGAFLVRSSFLWIDALCINQSDTNERNHQVSFMASIFRNALKVVVWIGDARPGPVCDVATYFTLPIPESICDMGIEIIAHRHKSLPVLTVSDAIKIYQAAGKEYLDQRRRSLGTTKETFLQILYRHFNIPLDSNGQAAMHTNRFSKPCRHIDHSIRACLIRTIRCLCKRPYWTRLWILQEMLLARELEVMCGADTISLSNLIAALNWMDAEEHTMFQYGEDLEDMGYLTSNVQTYTTPPVVRAIVKRSRLKIGSQSWAILSSGDFANQQCENVLDRVFGLLGLLPKDADIVVDYSKSAEQLLVHVLYKYNLSSKGPFWQKNWPQADFHLKILQALQLFDIDEENLRRFAQALCDHDPPITTDEEAMGLWKSVSTCEISSLKSTESIDERPRKRLRAS
jgi:hypothetical protein